MTAKPYNPVFADADLTPEEEAYLREEKGQVAAEAPPAPEPPAPESQMPAGGPQQAQETAAPDGQKAAGEPSEADGEDDPEIEAMSRRERDPKTGRWTKFVPHQALHKARAEHKATKEELQQQQQRFDRLEGRFQQLNDLLIAPANAPGKTPQAAGPAAKPSNPFEEPLPNIEEDLVGYLDVMQRRQAYQYETAQVAQANQAVRSASQREMQQFAAKQPAFTDAVNFLEEQQHKVLEAEGVTDKAERERLIVQDANAMILRAFQSRRSPAEVLWNLAQARGFRPGSATTPAVSPQHQANVAQIAQQKRGMAASTSMSGLGQAAGALTLAQIADMSDDDFMRFVKGYGGVKAFERDLGKFG